MLLAPLASVVQFVLEFTRCVVSARSSLYRNNTWVVLIRPRTNVHNSYIRISGEIKFLKAGYSSGQDKTRVNTAYFEIGFRRFDRTAPLGQMLDLELFVRTGSWVRCWISDCLSGLVHGSDVGSRTVCQDGSVGPDVGCPTI